MEAHLVDDLAYKEQFYWWHKVRRRRLLRMLADCLGGGTRVLEIGCGTGAKPARARTPLQPGGRARHRHQGRRLLA